MVYFILIKIRCCFVGPAIGSGAFSCVFVEKQFQKMTTTLRGWVGFVLCSAFLVLFEPRIIILLTGMVMVSIGWVALWLFWHWLKVIAKFEFRLSHESIYFFILIQWIVKVPSPKRCSKLELNKQLHQILIITIIIIIAIECLCNWKGLFILLTLYAIIISIQAQSLFVQCFNTSLLNMSQSRSLPIRKSFHMADNPVLKACEIAFVCAFSSGSHSCIDGNWITCSSQTRSKPVNQSLIYIEYIHTPFA